MTTQELSERYHVPDNILDAHEQSAVHRRHAVHHHYTDQDLAQISLLLTLYDLGFSQQGAQEYLRLSQCKRAAAQQRLKMLERRRADFLAEMHRKENLLDRVDYLRYHLIQSYNDGKQK